MNKIIYGVLLLLVVGFVSAQGQMTQSREVTQNSGDAQMVQNQEQVQLRLSNATGLPNAMLQVRNQETAQHLEQVWAKIQEKRQLQIAKLNNATAEKQLDNSTLVEGKGSGKFLGLFKAQHEYRYQVLQNGTVVDKPKAFGFLWSKQIVE